MDMAPHDYYGIDPRYFPSHSLPSIICEHEHCFASEPISRDLGHSFRASPFQTFYFFESTLPTHWPLRFTLILQP